MRTLLQLLWVKNYESITMEEIQNQKDGQNGKTANSEERGRKRENEKMLVSFRRRENALMMKQMKENSFKHSI